MMFTPLSAASCKDFSHEDEFVVTAGNFRKYPHFRSYVFQSCNEVAVTRTFAGVETAGRLAQLGSHHQAVPETKEKICVSILDERRSGSSPILVRLSGVTFDPSPNLPSQAL